MVEAMSAIIGKPNEIDRDIAGLSRGFDGHYSDKEIVVLLPPGHGLAEKHILQLLQAYLQLRDRMIGVVNGGAQGL